jgi:uncharacterized protein (DUF885 family)
MDGFTLSNMMADELLELSPISSTLVGVPGRDHLWDDFSPGGVARRLAILRRYRGAFVELPGGGGRWERLAVRVASRFIDEQIEMIDHGEHLRDLNNIASPLQDMRQVLDVQDTSSWEDVITRLRTIREPLTGLKTSLDEGRRQGLLVARRQVEAAAEQARVQAGDESSFEQLATRLESASEATPEEVSAMRSAVGMAKQAFSEFADYLETTYLPDAIPVDGVGEERYVRSARRFLGTEPDPRALYRWGWDEVRALRDEMVDTAARIDPTSGLDAVIDLLESDPSRCAQSQEEFVAFVTERLRVAVRDLDGTVFDIPEPVKRVDVKIAPPGTALGAYYLEPTEDFSRPGSVWWSTGGNQTLPLWDEVSTAYHEGFPGHHLQIGITLTLAEHLSRLHRLLIWYPGYGEGWALYTELLMNELGYLEKPEYVLGMLAAEMLRACRVVIDVGSHLDLPIPNDAPFHPGERWSFDLGVEMLIDFAYLTREYAESEMTRYLGWPGQAISYKVGERVILELRDEFLRRGDLKEFHARVLGSGPVGLDLLRSLVLDQD